MTTPTAQDDDLWIKSSFSGDNGACVEYQPGVHTVIVGDTKDHLGTTLTFGRPTWAQLIAGVKEGEFDL